MIVIDNAINPILLRSLWAVWPDETCGWHKYDSADSQKFGTRDASYLPTAASVCLREIVGVIPNQPNIFADFDLHGAGLHMIPPGGYLRRHLDSDIMPITGWRRELSAVLFANPRWGESDGGAFLLDGCEKVFPKFNRLVIFETNDESWHEVTDVTGPDPRCTLSMFFWSTQPVTGKRHTAQFEKVN